MPGRTGSRLGHALGAWTVFAGWLCFGAAQIISFETTPLPGPKSLQVIQALYMYGGADNEGSPDASTVKAHLDFNALSLAASVPSVNLVEAEAKIPPGFEIAVLSYDRFWKEIDPLHFCCNASDVTFGRCRQTNRLILGPRGAGPQVESGLYSLELHAGVKHAHEPGVPADASKSGVYVLVFSNCGQGSINGTVRGHLIVRHDHGYLPGNEYPKRMFYIDLFAVNVIIGIVWICMLSSASGSANSMHLGISGTVIVSLVEGLAWLLYYYAWNLLGVRDGLVRGLFAASVLLAVAKALAIIVMALLTAKGVGLTNDGLDGSGAVKLQVYSFFYFLSAFASNYILAFRYSHALPRTVMLLVNLPVSLLHGCMAYWLFSSLNKQIKRAKGRNEDEMAKLFGCLWWRFALAMSLFVIAFALQLAVADPTVLWRYQWIFSDGAPQAASTLVIYALMRMWSPSANQSFQYAPQANLDDDVEPAARGHLDVEPVATKPPTRAPEVAVIGAPDPEGDPEA